MGTYSWFLSKMGTCSWFLSKMGTYSWFLSKKGTYSWILQIPGNFAALPSSLVSLRKLLVTFEEVTASSLQLDPE